MKLASRCVVGQFVHEQRYSRTIRACTPHYHRLFFPPLLLRAHTMLLISVDSLPFHSYLSYVGRIFTVYGYVAADTHIRVCTYVLTISLLFVYAKHMPFRAKTSRWTRERPPARIHATVDVEKKKAPNTRPFFPIFVFFIHRFRTRKICAYNAAGTFAFFLRNGSVFLKNCTCLQ